MRPAERTLLLLCGALGDGLRPLSLREYRTLRLRAAQEKPSAGRSAGENYFLGLGYDAAAAEHITALLERQAALDVFLARAAQQGVNVLTRLSERFPARLRRLENDSPALLFWRGDLRLLERPCVCLVGSRALLPENRAFAERIGQLAAREGLVLVSGDAAGADRAAQDACLSAGGNVICIVPDELTRHAPREHMLFCSEEGYQCAFTSARALHRNHLIHALGEKVFVAQCGLRTGGTWSGTADNLRRGLSPVFAFGDGSEAMAALASLGAELLPQAPASIAALAPRQLSIFDDF